MVEDTDASNWREMCTSETLTIVTSRMSMNSASTNVIATVHWYGMRRSIRSAGP